MKYVQLGSAFLFLFLLAGCEEAVKEVAEAPKKMASATEDVVSEPEAEAADYYVIDVRSQKEWDEGHLDNAIHIPHTEIGERIAEVTADKNAKICLHWRKGGRAGTALKTLEGLGFKNVENLGGMDDAKKFVDGLK